MSTFYSASANAFYDPAICAPPEDAIAITDDQHQALMTAQAAGKVIQAGKDGAPVAVAPPVVPVDLRAYAASARYAKETAGITVGTAQIATDRESQALITGMWAAAQINPQIQVSFKSDSGFVTIGAAQVAKIAAAVAGYVQACFTAEAGVATDIASGKVKTPADVDAVFAAVASTFPTTAS